MEKKVTISFVETNDELKNKKLAEIFAGGFYEFLKINGYLRKNPERNKKVEKILEDSNRIHQSLPEL